MALVAPDPVGLAVFADGRKVYVTSGISNKLSVINAETLAIESSINLSREPRDPDGRDDGLAWSTPRGVRQTPFLAGRVEQTAPYNWIGENGSLQDNMARTMTRLGGEGLPAESLAAIESYLLTGLRAPVRNMEAEGHTDQESIREGREVFMASGCPSCHIPINNRFTDQQTHFVNSMGILPDVRTFDTPSLRMVGVTAPYYHDGRFRTLESLVNSIGDTMGHTSHLF